MKRGEILAVMFMYLILGFRLGAYVTYLRWEFIDLQRLVWSGSDYLLVSGASVPLIIMILGGYKD
jgi:hypothetical protein